MTLLVQPVRPPGQGRFHLLPAPATAGLLGNLGQEDQEVSVATAALKHETSAVLRIHDVYWTTPHRVGVGPGTALALIVGHASPSPRGKTGRSGALLGVAPS